MKNRQKGTKTAPTTPNPPPTHLPALTLTALTALTLLQPTLQCTAGKCVFCRQNVKCFACRNSEFRGGVQNDTINCATDEITTIPNCEILTMTWEGEVLCSVCKPGYITQAGSRCQATQNNCFTATYLNSGNFPQETCILCPAGRRLRKAQICGRKASTPVSACPSASVYTYKTCVPSNRIDSSCLASEADGEATVTIPDGNPENLDVNDYPMKCAICANGYARNRTGGECVVKDPRVYRAECYFLVRKEDRCSLCDYANGYYAVGTVSGKQECSKGARGLGGAIWLGLGSLVMVGLLGQF